MTAASKINVVRSVHASNEGLLGPLAWELAAARHRARPEADLCDLYWEARADLRGPDYFAAMAELRAAADGVRAARAGGRQRPDRTRSIYHDEAVLPGGALVPRDHFSARGELRGSYVTVARAVMTPFQILGAPYVWVNHPDGTTRTVRVETEPFFCAVCRRVAPADHECDAGRAANDAKHKSVARRHANYVEACRKDAARSDEERRRIEALEHGRRAHRFDRDLDADVRGGYPVERWNAAAERWERQKLSGVPAWEPKTPLASDPDPHRHANRAERRAAAALAAGRQPGQPGRPKKMGAAPPRVEGVAALRAAHADLCAEWDRGAAMFERRLYGGDAEMADLWTEQLVTDETTGAPCATGTDED